MAAKIPRPVSVWITQTLIALFILLLSFGLALTWIRSVPTLVNAPGGSASPMWVTLGVVVLMYLLFIGGLGFVFWGLAQRRQLARWVSVVFLGFSALQGIIAQFSISPGPIERFIYKNDVERISEMLTGIFLSGLVFALAAVLATSKANNRFFGSVEEEETLRLGSGEE